MSHMFNIILFEPEIPPNTGNIMRLCVNASATLHLIHPLGFSLSEKSLRRAGMDYRDMANVREYSNLQQCYLQNNFKRVFACTTKAKQWYSAIDFQADDAFIFGPETRGLPESVLNDFPMEQKLRVPMLKNSRSINLANTVSVILYEAWRQCDFVGGV